ncbi:MAG: tRNA-dihydrouridine synthase [Desulfomonilia bacterium]|jgi:tRNA-dihydrouridine synthase B
MKLYGLDLKHGLLLAPLSGYTSWPMRVLCRRYGAELCYTEMISAEGLVRNPLKSKSLLERPGEDAPLVAQLFTTSVPDAALAARMIEDAGFDGIDINMGCPVKKVVRKGAGAALMRNLPLAERLASSVAGAVHIPVSVKMRAGWDSSSINASELAAALKSTGISCLILHPRTRADMYKGSPRWELLPLVKRAAAVPVIASGDIRAPEDLTRLESLGADGYMVGRSAVGRPWIFRELTGGSPPGIQERREIMLEHLQMLCSLYGDHKGTAHMKKFISGYVRGTGGASLLRNQACYAINSRDLEKIIKGLSDLPDSVIK